MPSWMAVEMRINRFIYLYHKFIDGFCFDKLENFDPYHELNV